MSLKLIFKNKQYNNVDKSGANVICRAKILLVQLKIKIINDIQLLFSHLKICCQHIV